MNRERNDGGVDNASVTAPVIGTALGKPYCNNCNGKNYICSCFNFHAELVLSFGSVDEDSGGGLIKVRFGLVDY